jgi:hypothetical protein
MLGLTVRAELDEVTIPVLAVTLAQQKSEIQVRVHGVDGTRRKDPNGQLDLE